MGWRTDRDLELLPRPLAGARWRDSSKENRPPQVRPSLEGGRVSWRLFASTSAGWTSTRSRWWLRSSPPRPPGQDLLDHDQGVAGARRLAEGGGGAPRGDGEHGDLLAADLQPPRADRDGGAGGQRRSHEAGAGTEDGRQGRGVDRRAPPVRAAEGQLRSRAGAARATRPAPLPADADEQRADEVKRVQK